MKPIAYAIPIAFFVGVFIGLDGAVSLYEKHTASANEMPIIKEEARDTLDDWQQLQMAIALTESRFRPDVVGRNGDTGVLQLLKIYVDEVNRLYDTGYTIEDAFDMAKSFEMFDLMQTRYNPGHDIELGIRYHNKSPYYRKEVLNNKDFVRRYEEVRKIVTNETQRTRQKDGEGACSVPAPTRSRPAPRSLVLLDGHTKPAKNSAK